MGTIVHKDANRFTSSFIPGGAFALAIRVPVAHYQLRLKAFIFGAYPESPSYDKNLLWERLSAAKLNDHG